MENVYPNALQNMQMEQQKPKRHRASQNDYIKAGLLIVLLLYEVAFLVWIQSEYYNNFVSQFYP